MLFSGQPKKAVYYIAYTQKVPTLSSTMFNMESKDHLFSLYLWKEYGLSDNQKKKKIKHI